MTIVEFIEARLAEREAIAKRAAACELVQHDGHEPGDWSWLRSYGQPQPSQIALIDHQACSDPAWVLADVAAKRAIVAEYAALTASPDRLTDAALHLTWNVLGNVVRQIAQIDSGHPGYDPEWQASYTASPPSLPVRNVSPRSSA